jgi:transcriptional regulator with GAF, ATPase, and Fis domain
VPANVSLKCLPIRGQARSYILEVLATCHGKIEGLNGAAAMLNLKPGTLRYRMRNPGIEKENAR